MKNAMEDLKSSMALCKQYENKCRNSGAGRLILFAFAIILTVSLYALRKLGVGRSGRYPDDVFIYRTNRRPLGHLSSAHSDFMSGRPCIRCCTNWTFMGDSWRWTQACRCKNQKRQVYQAEISAVIFAPGFAPAEHNVLKKWIFLNQTGILDNWWFVQRNSKNRINKPFFWVW